MNKAFLVATVLGSLLVTCAPFVPNMAFADTGCVSVYRTLSRGSRGADVTRLQQFLSVQGYPGSGSWMITGYYGAATVTAVYDFQATHGLSQTGVVDSATSAALNSVSCGYGTVVPQTGVIYQSVTTPAYTSSYGYTTPTLFSISPNSGASGTTVTVTGTGFTSTNNTVSFGSVTIPNITSLDGRTISFVVPQYLNGSVYGQIALGTYNLTVTNGAGYTSNAQSFTISGYGANSIPSIVSMTGPSSLGLGQSGSWTIAMNNPGMNTATIVVTWGDGNSSSQQFAAYQSNQTMTLSHTYNSVGTFVPTVAIVSSIGAPSVSSTAVTVTNWNGNATSPSITAISPNVARVGTSVTLFGTNLSGSNTILFNGTGALYNAYSQNSNSISFVVPSSISAYCAAGQACPQYAQVITPGTYSISITNQNGTSNSVPLTVTQ